jgi:MbtH protein
MAKKKKRSETMTEQTKDDARRYAVVVNGEEQYSIWPEDRSIPNGWRSTGMSGLKAECLAHIKEIWVDMRPASLRGDAPRI